MRLFINNTEFRISRIFLSGYFILVALITQGQTFTPADQGSKVKFIIRNFGINTSGTFEGLQGSIVFDPGNLASSWFDVSVDASTVDTDINARDNHLRKEEYFDVTGYPRIHFKSTKISITNQPEYLYMFGVLTIKGISKEVKFPFKALPRSDGYLFEGEFEINRRDFGVGGRSFSLSDDLKVELSVFARKN